MPRKTKTAAADQAALPRIPAELLEQLIPAPVTPAQLEDIFQQFKKAFIERALGAEMSQHLGYAPDQAKPEGAVNHRNGKGTKRVLTDTGALAIEVPRDRHGSFEPQLIGKHERRFTGFDDKIIAMGSRRGLCVSPHLGAAVNPNRPPWTSVIHQRSSLLAWPLAETLRSDLRKFRQSPKSPRRKTKGSTRAYVLTLVVYGAAGRNRTHDPLVRSQVLYPAELQPLSPAL